MVVKDLNHIETLLQKIQGEIRSLPLKKALKTPLIDDLNLAKASYLQNNYFALTNELTMMMETLQNPRYTNTNTDSLSLHLVQLQQSIAPVLPQTLLQGDQGEQGVPGPKGDQGEQGIPGPKGEPGLVSLPYSGSLETSDTVFSISNTGTGQAIQGKSATSYGVSGISSSVAGVYGYSDSVSDCGVYGESNSTTGIGVGGYSPTCGVYGYTDTASGYGVCGYNTSGTGIFGVSTSATGNGVYGSNYGYSASSSGVYGSNSLGTGVYGKSTSGNGVRGQSTSGSGVRGETNSDSNSGVCGYNSASGPGVYGYGLGSGVRGEANSASYYGVYGSNPLGTGVYGKSTSGSGVRGESNSASSSGVYGNNPLGVGVYGVSNSNSSYGVSGFNSGSGYGVYGISTGNNGVFGCTDSLIYGGVCGCGKGIGVYGYGPGNGVYGYSNSNGNGVYGDSVSGYAGYFNGNVFVKGTLTKSGGSFIIDHPLDPENKYLHHSFVESPDMKNITDGIATLDQEGMVQIELAEWFETLNKDFRYQLTAINAAMPNLHIATEIINNRFQIGGGLPGGKVAWQVTGIRQDPYAEAHPVVVETFKNSDEKGCYLHPELYGQPPEKGIGYSDHQIQKETLIPNMSELMIQS